MEHMKRLCLPGFRLLRQLQPLLPPASDTSSAVDVDPEPFFGRILVPLNTGTYTKVCLGSRELRLLFGVHASAAAGPPEILAVTTRGPRDAR